MANIGKARTGVQASRDLLYETHKQLIAELSRHFNNEFKDLQTLYERESQNIKDMAEGDNEIIRSTPNAMTGVICDFQTALQRIRELEFCSIFTFYEIGIKDIICEYIKPIKRTSLPNMMCILQNYAKKKHKKKLMVLCSNKVLIEYYRYMRNYYAHMNFDSKDWNDLNIIFENNVEPLFSTFRLSSDTILIPNDETLLAVLDTFYVNLKDIEDELLIIK